MIGEKKKRIGLIFGGYSNEHEVSISSAKTVFQAFNSEINKKRFKVKSFYIDKYGDWLDNDLSEKILNDEIKSNNIKKQEIVNQQKINFLDGIEFQNIDVWFPLLHGLNGEDGSIHGLLQYTRKPIVGCGILGSAIGMDKIMMKTIFSNLKIPQVNYLAFQNEDLDDREVKKKVINEILKKLNFPFFVKPSNSGSSLGISKVINESEILQSLEKAQKIDSRILVEEGLEVREIECGIIGNSELLTSEIGEIKYESDWYDYDSKYYSNNKIIIPAEIDSKITKEIKKIAIQSCRALNIFGFARVDFFLEKSSNKILLNEINTIPGFTTNSMFPMLWKASGLNIEQLVAKLVDISLDL
ncbi:D-alanine--D-alanine ligase [Prochlorococcus marinus str. MIT 9215]|uniref:D-alanine--D-alanine ligase n=1 Tax=Prochlorococcus marinus (strain MIT 9215) TaxID=93060 RepID=DDL_PROM2|nr:D-alanine--D-alanine ligase family protein [Prochlorococcus marinus]A8G6B7.1 RecName: Full=D-alanine--D-alanine ligase; AltName: Full=D-Ala-D-Ala ligase; AltName: Full=D-alanylalanine synthetase [Prochlorococcus marinus str. MIT 9215]ABV51148.1 D-alanine--D-alanine ligase [Prochlorococcus marinus str. MIT 9215]